MIIEVLKAYTARYPDPIFFDAGVAVQVAHGDQEFPGWFWCQASGKEGWVHGAFLSSSTGTATSIRAYSAGELTVGCGQRGTPLQSLDGWACIRLDAGEEGWIPMSHLRQNAS